ncbi:hypothetical protein SS1G_05731 [Sclerotinia sclerotiorum 1980 UF-70]|uniref:Uncharacterized protein n=2 Tax=Sclerotinia sclerotiorum (strain ATCC 18683 / 1980 / Ss-1) TaxID=665079 RepID=A7EK85_SCLS1|nr:hypothetical protein SS1G_05731 [Sclerotinia sclerotiorum 1980 UF-70]APA09994.1 hypothetical protein sscle_05g047640 [Sclerotinia sclerotiorum 1980 UF-70]EDO03251.1 hypothetical protein SS1G_05731 [Sclerotinia sclerotiorum 1980 UF-70]
MVSSSQTHLAFPTFNTVSCSILSSFLNTILIQYRSIMSSKNSSRERSCESEVRSTRSTPGRDTRSPSPLAQNSNELPDIMRSRILASPKESDAECWERMLALQKEYHCYQSARLEAAVEALENGWLLEDVPRPSRLCLDLINDGLKAQIQTFDTFRGD